MHFICELVRRFLTKRSRDPEDLTLIEQSPPSELELPESSINYLSEMAQKSYARQADLDESVWRSLPFFAATLALAVTLLSKVAEAFPSLPTASAGWVAYVLFCGSVVCFAWTLRWFADLLWPRTYEYPADDAEVWSYAKEMLAYHQGRGLENPELEDEVVLELKALVANQFGDAARTNLTNNAAKLKARSQLLLFILLGFALVILAEGITYVSALVARQEGGTIYVQNSNSTSDPVSAIYLVACKSPDAAKASINCRRRPVHEVEFVTRDYEEVVATQGGKPPQTSPQRPVAPPPQIVKKNEPLPAPPRPLQDR